MINSKVFFQGLRSLKGSRSPAIPLAACFVALGALLKDAGFNIQQSAASSFFTYALPGQLVMAESLLVGASVINIFIAVWLVNFRLYPMTVSLFPLLVHKSQPKWKYYLSSHFLAVSSWLIAKESYKKINKKHRIDFWIGIGIGTWSTAILMTIVGYLSAEYLNKDMLIGLAIVNPVYFFCMMIGAMKNLSISIAVILGTILGPLIYLYSTEWSLLFAGLIAGTIAFTFGKKMESNFIIVLTIVATSLATFISRFMGAITSEKVSVKSKVFNWFNCVAYSTLAALLGRMIIFPAGVLSDSELIIRILVLFICISIFIYTKKNLVLPTIISAILLSVLSSV